jgi:oxygen-independent coproporphyrinogen-3 oxidase
VYCYLHVPFCASHCIYCDFAVVLAKRPQAKRNPLGEAYIETQPYLKALCHEIDHRLASLPPGQALQTLYVGGGTPALMSARDYQTLFANLQRYVTLAPNAEITLEANPSHRASPPADYRAVGFNRISLGVQSFNNIELKRLSRTHTAGEGLAAIKQWQGAGFTNLSIDLMYGLPGQTVASWQHTLQIAVDTGVSAYLAVWPQGRRRDPLGQTTTLRGLYPAR